MSQSSPPNQPSSNTTNQETSSPSFSTNTTRSVDDWTRILNNPNPAPSAIPVPTQNVNPIPSTRSYLFPPETTQSSSDIYDPNTFQVFSQEVQSQHIPGSLLHLVDILVWCIYFMENNQQVTSYVLQIYKSGSVDSFNRYLAENEINRQSPKNRISPGGLDLAHATELNSIITPDNYFFDIYYLTKKFSKRDFVNPFTLRPFRQNFVERVKNLLSKLNQIFYLLSGLDTIITPKNLQIKKITELLKRMQFSPPEIAEKINRFYNLSSDQLLQFAVSNLNLPNDTLQFFSTIDEKREFLLGKWIERACTFVKDRELYKIRVNQLSL